MVKNARRIIMIMESRSSGWMRQNLNTMYMILIITATLWDLMSRSEIYIRSTIPEPFMTACSGRTGQNRKPGSLRLGRQPAIWRISVVGRYSFFF